MGPHRPVPAGLRPKGGRGATVTAAPFALAALQLKEQLWGPCFHYPPARVLSSSPRDLQIVSSAPQTKKIIKGSPSRPFFLVPTPCPQLGTDQRYGFRGGSPTATPAFLSGSGLAGHMCGVPCPRKPVPQPAQARPDLLLLCQNAVTAFCVCQIPTSWRGRPHFPPCLPRLGFCVC